MRKAAPAAQPRTAEYGGERLESYWFVATLVGRNGDPLQKLEIIRRQLPAREELAAAEQHGFIDRYNLAGTYVYMGVLSMQMGDVHGALENQQRAFDIRENLLTLDPDRTRASRALTISYEYLGLAKDKAGDTKSALQLQERGLRMRESLVNADPLNTDLRLMLVESYRYVGDMYLKLGEKTAARDHYTRQFSLVKDMVAAEPANAQLLYNQAVAFIKMGDVEAADRRTGSALANYRQALQIREHHRLDTRRSYKNRPVHFSQIESEFLVPCLHTVISQVSTRPKSRNKQINRKRIFPETRTNCPTGTRPAPRRSARRPC